jgi:hypothetical protein
MELADQFQLTALLASSAMQVRRNRPRMNQGTAGVPSACQPRAHNVKQQRCRCGTCAACQDNARWERIFQAKFADPDYYARRVIRHESPLTSI